MRLYLTRSLSHAPVRKQLWLCGSAMAMFIVVAAVMNQFVPPEKAVNRGMMGLDFVVFYTAGTFVHDGRTSELYDLDALRAFESHLARRENLELNRGFGPWWNPPFVAWVFVPLAMMPYQAALLTWMGVSLIAMLVAIVLMSKMLLVARASSPCERVTRRGWKPVPRESSWPIWGLVPLLVLTSMPFIQAMSHGQNTLISLMLLTIVVTLWRADRALLAGLACGLLFYKPQLGAIVAGVMVLSMGRRAALGVAIGGAGLLLVTLLTMPGSLNDWLTHLPGNLRWMQEENAYSWERHATLKAFWRLLIQGHATGRTAPVVTALTMVCSIALGAALLACAVRGRADRDKVITATIAVMPLLMPFYFDYDLLLLAIPVVLFAAEMWRDGFASRVDRAALWGWAVLYIAMIVNPIIGKHACVNVNVPLIALLAGLLIRRAMTQPQAAVETAPVHVQVARVAA